MQKEEGGKLGLKLRDGQITAVGSTERIRQLNRMLHGSRPNVDLHRTRIFTEYYKQAEGESPIKQRYTALAKVFETMPDNIYDHERLIGWQGSQIRSNQICIEVSADWLKNDITDFETRNYDPWLISENDKKEMIEVHIPYWKEKTITYKWNKRVPEAGRATSGLTDCSNFLSNPGAHFQADMEQMFNDGIEGIYHKCDQYLDEIDFSQPDGMGKREFYEGLKGICSGIKKYGENMRQAAYAKASKTKAEKRKAELTAAGDRIKKICWEKPETFVECLHFMWLLTVFVMTESPAPASCGLGRVDQYLWPYLKKDLDEGIITVDEAFEYLEEFNIKCTNMVWLMPENLSKLFGGYYRWAGSYAVGGVDEKGQDAVNLLSYMFLRSSRSTRTTAPPVHVNLSPKNPDSFLHEAVKLSAEGLGNPSFFNVETMHQILLHKACGKDKINNLPLRELRKRGCTFGCQEAGLTGYVYGHADSCIINLGNCVSLALNDGFLPEGCPGWGASKRLGIKTGDVRQFKNFEDFYHAVMGQYQYAIDVGNEHMLVAEKMLMEEYPMPVQTMLGTGVVEKGRDITSGSAVINQGPCYALIGVADFVDSLAAMKKLVFEEQFITMEQLLEALSADFIGFEDIQKLCEEAPKWGNDDDYVDQLLAEAVPELTDYVKTKKNLRGGYCDISVQNNQVQVPAGQQCWALPNGRKARTPFADALSAEQQKDRNGPLAAINSYAKIDHASFNNGTILNMWVSKQEVIEE